MTANDRKQAKQAGLEGSQLGPYRVGGRLGIGGAAAVYLGRRTQPPSDDHPASDEVVALKVIHDHLALEGEFIQMFLDEARVALLLHHPNVVRTFELGREDEQLFMAMEYLHGQSLHEVFVRGTRHGARLPVDLVAWIGSQVARALHYAHTLADASGKPLHLIHRDVSPRNIFIGYDGTVKLIDFGIAHAVGRMAKTKVGQMKGTFSYIAPERALGGACDHRADVFSLAVALFEAATGRRLFRGEDDVQTLRNVLSGKVPDPRELRDGFPDELARILLRALSLRPKDRQETALELADELDAFVAKTGLEPPQPRLSLMMGTIFAEDRAKKDAGIDKLRGGKPTDDGAGDEERDVSNVVVASSRYPRRAGGSRVWVATAALLATGALAAGAFLVWGRPTPKVEPAPAALAPSPATSTAAAPATVTIDVSVIPAVEATFELGDQKVTGSLARFEPLAGDTPVTVIVRAEGFEDARVAVMPDEHRTVAVPLREKAEAPAAAATPPPRSRVAARASRPAKAKPQPTLSEMLDKRH